MAYLIDITGRFLYRGKELLKIATESDKSELIKCLNADGEIIKLGPEVEVKKIFDCEIQAGQLSPGSDFRLANRIYRVYGSYRGKVTCYDSMGSFCSFSNTELVRIEL